MVIFIVTLQQLPDGIPAGSLVAVLQNGDEQRLWIATLQVNERRAMQNFMQFCCRQIQEVCGHVVKFGEFHFIKGADIKAANDTGILTVMIEQA